MIDKIDFLIKTFRRPECIIQLLTSINHYYPDAKVIVADDGGSTKEFYEQFNDLQIDITVRFLPFDTGLSAGRNIMVEETERPYKLILDDDFVFTQHTDLSKMVKEIEKKDVGVVCGSLWQDGRVINYECELVKKGRLMVLKPTDKKDIDIGLNFCLIRSEVFDEVKWDDQFKIGGEHMDFFLRLKETKWKVRYLPEVRANHVKVASEEYAGFRSRKDWYVVFDKHDIDYIINAEGKLYDFKDRENFKVLDVPLDLGKIICS